MCLSLRLSRLYILDFILIIIIKEDHRWPLVGLQSACHLEAAEFYPNTQK